MVILLVQINQVNKTLHLLRNSLMRLNIMTAAKNIHTNRTILRPVNTSDTNFILQANTGNVRKYFIPFDNATSVKDWIAENICKMKKREKLEMIIENERTKEKIGMVALDSLQDKGKIIPRIWIAQPHQGKGYAKECLAEFIAYLQSLPGFENKRIEYEVDIDNLASIQLAKSLGLTKICTKEDNAGQYYVYS